MLVIFSGVLYKEKVKYHGVLLTSADFTVDL